MTKIALSKLPLQTLFLICFCLGIIISVLFDRVLYEFIFSSLALVSSFFLAVLKNKYSVIFIGLAIAIIFTNLIEFNSRVEFNSGVCRSVEVLSSAKKFKTQFIYKVMDKEKFLIAQEEDDLLISDQIKVCLREKIILEEKDRHYLLSHYSSDDLYSADKAELISKGKSTRRKIYDLSVKFREISNKLYSGDSSVLAYGLIFGSSTEFSNQTKSDLKKSGTSHLVAVSGYNVSIITAWLFTGLRTISKNFAGGFSLAVLIFFYLITGGSASLLRAGIMGSLILISRFVGRKVLPIHLIMLAASLILAMNPYAIYDLGFQLSFFATAGIFYLAEPIEILFSFGRFKNMLIIIFSETLSAQIFVLPILVGNFGQFSLIAPLTNILILPLVPLAMFAVFLSLVSYLISDLLGIFFGGLSEALLSYILFIIHWSSKLKFSSISFEVPAVYSYLIGYLLVFVLTAYLRRNFEKKR